MDAKDVIGAGDADVLRKVQEMLRQTASAGSVGGKTSVLGYVLAHKLVVGAGVAAVGYFTGRRALLWGGAAFAAWGAYDYLVVYGSVGK